MVEIKVLQKFQKDLTGVDLSKVINDFVNKNSQSIEPKTEIIDAKTTNVDND